MSRWADQKKPKQEEPQEPQTLEEFEEGTAAGMEKLHQAFRDRAAKEDQRVMDVVDCNYYFVVCFSNRAQLYEFCEKTGLNPDEIYIDGRAFARKINRALQTPDTKFPKVQPFNKDYVNRSRG